MSGERSNAFWKTLKKNKGGRSFDKGLIHKFNTEEISRTKAAYNFSLQCNLHRGHHPVTALGERLQTAMHDITHTTIDESGITYNPLKHLLHHKTPMDSKLQWTLHDIQQLLDMILIEVYTRFGSKHDAAEGSTLYRLYCVYEKQLKDTKRLLNNMPFEQWLLILHEYNCNILVTQTSPTIKAITGDIQYTVYDRELDEADSWVKLVRQGTIPHNLLATATEFVTMQVTTYYQATIYGVTFRGRGINYRETKPADTKLDQNGRTYHCPHNPYNKLSEYYNFVKHYSSWCRYKVLSDKRIRGEKFKQYYGQLNFFFRLRLPSDPFLNGIAVASVTSRSYTATPPDYSVQSSSRTDVRVNRIDIHPHAAGLDNFDVEAPAFIPITSIYASPILVFPFDSSHKYPINCENKHLTTKTKRIYSKSSNVIGCLYMIDLFPKNKVIKYHDDARSLYNAFDNDD